MVKDFLKLLKPNINKLGRRVKFCTERRGVEFKYYEYDFPRYFKIAFTEEAGNYFIRIYEEVKTCVLPTSAYSLRKKYPELFKEEIIKDFKKNNCKRIITTFESDDEIWNFLIENGVVNIEDEEGIEDVTSECKQLSQKVR